jgi:hypothetical protein
VNGLILRSMSPRCAGKYVLQVSISPAQTAVTRWPLLDKALLHGYAATATLARASTIYAARSTATARRRPGRLLLQETASTWRRFS